MSRTWTRRIGEAMRAPVARYLTALAQYHGGRDAALGRPVKRFAGI